ncbi:MAG: L-threonylcarbamoyladenylate synthase [Candidatus Pacebacteria bacterium]|nr:L-threonylcarbamoyladenylate synthase [Candidatus Paceibacterota bacterium]
MIEKLGKKEIDIVASAYKSGKLAVIPTDTVYGIACSAFDVKAVLRLYKIKKRDLDKPFIILISSLKDLKLFNIELSDNQKKWLKNIWPEKMTVILNCNDKRFKYLHRGKRSLAFRVPNEKWLLKLISRVGPIVVPSANIQGFETAKTISEAYKYFGEKAIYIDGGKLNKKPSTIVSFEDGFKIIRKGS